MLTAGLGLKTSVVGDEELSRRYQGLGDDLAGFFAKTDLGAKHRVQWKRGLREA